MRPTGPNALIAVAVATTAGALVAALQVGLMRADAQGWTLDEVLPYAWAEAVFAALFIAAVMVAAAVTGRLARSRRSMAWALGAAVLTTTALAGLAAWRLAPSRSGPQPAAATPTGPRTVVLVTLDTLRRDHVSAYPDSLLPGLTPTLESLAAAGIRFDHARAPASLTLPVHTSMLTGRLPADHGVVRNGMVLSPSGDPALPTVLAAQGYRTGAFVSSSVLHGAHGLSRWFDVYRDRLGVHPAREAMLLSRLVLGAEPVGKLQKEPGDRTVDRALAWLGTVGDEPVFLWVHLYDPHAPHAQRPLAGGPEGAFDELPHPCDYAGHPAQRARVSPTRLFTERPALVDEAACRERSWERLARTVGTYAAEVAFADAQLGRLVEGLDSLGRWEDTALVVAADHGESLTEHQQTISHQYSLYEPVVRVPLVIRLPGGRGDLPAVVRAPVGTVQLAATLARLGGADGADLGGPGLLEVARGAGRGPADVASAPSPLPAGSAHAVAVLRGSHKVIGLGGHRYERYDLEVDPLERFPLRAPTDSPTPPPPERTESRQEVPRTVGLPLLPHPAWTLQRTRDKLWPRPEDERSWRPQPPETTPIYEPLESRADSVLEALEGRRLPDGVADESLPEGVRMALEELGYLN